MLNVDNNTDPTTSKANTTKQKHHQQIPSTPSSGGGPSTSRGDGGIASSSGASSSSMGGSSVASASSAHNLHHVEDDNSDSDHETINIDDPFIFTATDGVGAGGPGNEAGNFNERNNNDTDINEIDWTQTQGITPDSSLAWALDGHIRMRNEVSNRLFTQTGLVSLFFVSFVKITS